MGQGFVINSKIMRIIIIFMFIFLNGGLLTCFFFLNFYAIKESHGIGVTIFGNLFLIGISIIAFVKWRDHFKKKKQLLLDQKNR